MTNNPVDAPAPIYLLEKIANLAIVISAIALCGIVIVQSWQVIARYVFNNSPGWTEPVAILLLSTAMSLGAANGVYHQRHFRFPLLVDALPLKWQRICEALCNLVIAGIGMLMAYWGSTLFIDSITIRMAGVVMPQSSVFVPIALGGLLMTIFSLARIPQLFSASPLRQS